ncbi:MAG: hypothetical protein HXY20_06470 [Acidobacteria bacterium]|nr:hypothetical protein [Acidobacteriota bacterium]
MTAREKKFLIGGGTTAILIIGYYLVTTYTPGLSDTGTSVEIKRRTLLQHREIVSQEGIYRSRAEQYRQRLQQMTALLLPGDNPSIAGAELQKILKDMADRSGVEINRRTIQREQKLQGGIVKISVNIETNCEPDQLVQFLAAVENYEKRLVVDELMINAFRIQRRYQARPNLTVSGYIRVPEPKPETRSAG